MFPAEANTDDVDDYDYDYDYDDRDNDDDDNRDAINAKNVTKLWTFSVQPHSIGRGAKGGTESVQSFVTYS